MGFSNITIETEFLGTGINKTILNKEDVWRKFVLSEVTEEIKHLAPLQCERLRKSMPTTWEISIN